MKAEDFVHLHCHSTYSLLEGLPGPDEIVDRAVELGQNAVALADKGYTYGLIEFYKAAKSKGVKPILGMDAYIAARTRHDKESGVDTKRYPITLLAESQEGYENLLQLATAAALEGMYYKPRVDAELLTKFGRGIIALTGPIGAAIPQAALAEDGKRIESLVELYRGFFGSKNVYFELMDLPNVTGQAEVNQQLIEWGKRLDVPVVATCNAHYCRPEDAEAHDVLLCIQKNARVDDPSRFSMRDSDFSMRPFSEMERAFAHIPEALENTRVIADRCSLELDFSSYHIPSFPVPQGTDERAYLRACCEEGFAKRYANPTAEHKERLDYELEIIGKLGFSGYFLIVADFISEARRRGIIVGPGRGSAVGSMVSYCMGITMLDPIEHGLLFERFLNPERVSMPDIDIDFADTRRDEVLEYTREKYGRDRVMQICTFGTLAARAAVKDVGRAYGIPFLEMNSLAKLIPERPGTTLEEALQTQELKAAYDENPTYKKIIDTALKLEGKARHVSVHACGVVITEEPTVRYTAQQHAPKDDSVIITQSSGKPLESLGLLKMDFLGLMNLTVIQTTLETIKRTKNETLDIVNIPLDDKETFALLQRGDTTGVFQLESAGMRRYLKDLHPTQFDDITAMVSLYRPGPMEWIPSFIKRKHGKEKISYVHDDLRSVLEPTYGIGIYQEQILRIAQIFAGYSLGAADILRKAIGKKIKSELDAQREKFIAGAVEKGYEKALAIRIFDDVITPFAGYGFNKSHGAGYARIAYETAYLKAHYPVEFMAALLSSDAQRTDRVLIEINECRSMGIKVLPPDINESRRHFTAIPDAENPKNGGAIRFGLTAIKGIGDSSVQEIIACREEGGRFASIEDFAKRIPAKIVNKKTIEALAKSGALDSLSERRVLLQNYEMITEFAKASGDVSSAQTDMFAHLDADDAGIEFPVTEPASHLEKLRWEKETLGMYVSSHPLAGLGKYLRKKGKPIADLEKKDVGKKVTIAAMIESVKKITTKRGEIMAIALVEDATGKMEVTLFPKVYGDSVSLLESEGGILIIEGVIDVRAGQMQMRADTMKNASLETMITKAREMGIYDEDEAANGPAVVKNHTEDDDRVEMIDEEGNIVAGESQAIVEVSAELPAGKDDISEATASPKEQPASVQESASRAAVSDEEPAAISPTAAVSIHTVSLPSRAPKQLLLDLKSVLESFHGKERLQLKIGDQIIPLSITVNMSPLLEKRIEEVIARYAKAEADM